MALRRRPRRRTGPAWSSGGSAARCPPASGGTVEGTVTPNELQNAGGRGLGPGTGAGNEREWEEFIAAIKVGHTYANVQRLDPAQPARSAVPERRGAAVRSTNGDQKEYTRPAAVRVRRAK